MNKQDHHQNQELDKPLCWGLSGKPGDVNGEFPLTATSLPLQEHFLHVIPSDILYRS